MSYPQSFLVGAALLAALAGCAEEAPLESEGACPFECCTHRPWSVESDTALRAARAIRVTTLEASNGGPPVALAPGDEIAVLHHEGEGVWKCWLRGRTFSESPDGHPALEPIAWPETVWWVRIRAANGAEGWTDEPDHLGHKNRCE